MKIYWSIKTIPELVDLSEQDQQEAWRRCFRKTFFSWRVLGALGVQFGLLMVGFKLLRFILAGYIDYALRLEDVCPFCGVIVVGLVGIVWLIVFAGIPALFVTQVHIAMTRPLLRQCLSKTRGAGDS